MIWTNEQWAGMLPEFLSDFDPRPAKEQFNENYAHGGGWHPFTDKWKIDKPFEIGKAKLKYPGDPPLKELSRTVLHGQFPQAEMIILFESEMVAIVQKDGTFEVSRMD
jgi:hypothetical protein